MRARQGAPSALPRCVDDTACALRVFAGRLEARRAAGATSACALHQRPATMRLSLSLTHTHTHTHKHRHACAPTHLQHVLCVGVAGVGAGPRHHVELAGQRHVHIHAGPHRLHLLRQLQGWCVCVCVLEAGGSKLRCAEAGQGSAGMGQGAPVAQARAAGPAGLHTCFGVLSWCHERPTQLGRGATGQARAAARG